SSDDAPSNTSTLDATLVSTSRFASAVFLSTQCPSQLNRKTGGGKAAMILARSLFPGENWRCLSFEVPSDWKVGIWGVFHRVARQRSPHIYVTLKIDERDSAHGKREAQIYNHLKGVKSSHIGVILIRTVLDGFQIPSADGSHSHQCLVHPPLAVSLLELRNRTKAKVFPDSLLKPALIHILLALDFLHTEAHVIHTGMLLLVIVSLIY
ncbi:kinase-like domain-containing protein, partial [Penicillium alfredii]